MCKSLMSTQFIPQSKKLLIPLQRTILIGGAPIELYLPDWVHPVNA